MYSELGDEDETISADEDDMGRRYRMEGNFGGCKLWRIWRKIVQPPIFKPPIFFLYTKRL